MTEAVLTAERILDAAEQVLRRYGPAKTTVVDVARALGVSHGTIYRHFPSKSALREAVAARWLHRVSEPLQAVIADRSPAPQRLRRWFDTLMGVKRRKVLEDPELFATYHALVEDAGTVIQDHIEDLVSQVAGIIADGVAEGSFSVDDPQQATRAVFQATIRFHHPVHAGDWQRPGIEDDFDALWQLVMAGLTTGANGPASKGG